MLARDIIDNLSVLVPDRNVRFEAKPGIKAIGDVTLVRILLTNLLQNAWKYTRLSDDAWIELGVVEDEEKSPIYHVRDNGIGFDNDNRARILKPSSGSITGRSSQGADSGWPPSSESYVATVDECGPTARRERGRSSGSTSDLNRPSLPGVKDGAWNGMGK